MRTKFTTEEVQNIIDLYNKGYTQKKIASLYDTYNTSIRRILKRNNINIRGNDIIQSYIDYDRFISQNLSREESYFLGLLITDGCISGKCLTLGLQEKDIDMLEKFAKFLGSKVKVNKYFHKKHGIYQYQVAVRNEKICSNLKKLAVFDNKTTNLRLHLSLNFDILRGIIDGDGCVYSGGGKTLISISSKSKDFVEQISQFLFTKNVHHTINQRKDGLFSVHINKKKDVLFLYENLYNSTNLFFQRKKDKYGLLLEKSKRLYLLNSGNHVQES